MYYFLANRTQAVAVNGETSSHVSVGSEVPQGSVLGPCLLLLYINDLPEGLTATVRLFADNTVVHFTVTSDTDADTLQSDLDKLGKWEKIFKMGFHPGKCNVLIISRRTNIIHHQYTLHRHILESVESAK